MSLEELKGVGLVLMFFLVAYHGWKVIKPDIFKDHGGNHD